MARKAAAQVDEKAPPPVETAPVLNEPVEIEVTDEVPQEPVIDVSPQEPEPPRPAESPKPAEQDPAIKQRLDELDRANKELERKNRDQAEQLARGQQQLGNEQWQRFNAQYEGVVNALGAAQSELDAAKQAYKIAHGEGDVDALVEAQEKIGAASFEIRRLNGVKMQMDEAAEQAKRAPPPRQQPQQPTTEQMLANSGLSDRSKAWLRARPEYLTDVDKNTRLRHLDEVARFQSGDMERTTDAYFERLEILLGMKQEAAPAVANGSGNGAHPPAQPPAQQRQSAQVSAPPTREAPSMTTGRAPTSRKVTLTPEQREVASAIAQSRGISQQDAEKEYAKQLLRIEDDKKRNGG